MVDAAIIWSWRNDPGTRDMMLGTKPISWYEHYNWLARKLQLCDNLLLVIEAGNIPVGMVRYDRVDYKALVSIVISTAWRNEGVGTKVLSLSKLIAAKELEVTEIEAIIKADNIASIKAFEGAGYSNAKGGVWQWKLVASQ